MIFLLVSNCFNSLYFQIWEESAGENLLQIQLLTALRNFVCALGYQSSICYNMLLPILRSGVDINNPDTLNLLEDSVLVSFATEFQYFDVVVLWKL